MIFSILRRLLIYLVTITVLLFPNPLRAIAKSTRTIRGDRMDWRGQPLILDQWGVEEGLPSGIVQAIVHTRDGYLWLGTENGLVRFDGMKFTVFNRYNTAEIKHNDIKTLL